MILCASLVCAGLQVWIGSSTDIHQTANANGNKQVRSLVGTECMGCTPLEQAPIGAGRGSKAPDVNEGNQQHLHG